MEGPNRLKRRQAFLQEQQDVTRRKKGSFTSGVAHQREKYYLVQIQGTSESLSELTGWLIKALVMMSLNLKDSLGQLDVVQGELGDALI